jgi:hypothetical protein
MSPKKLLSILAQKFRYDEYCRPKGDDVKAKLVGTAILDLPENERKIIQQLKSDDIKNDRLIDDGI